jgi:hypothetical protein
MKNRERSLSQIPAGLVVGLVLMLVIQIGYIHTYKSSLDDSFRQLSTPAPVALYQGVSLGSDRLLSYLLLLGVQMHDNQKGQHINYVHLDYSRLQHWLLTTYELNPLSDYPGFLASRVYGQIGDHEKLRRMISVIQELFDRDPRQHWRRMTEASLLAKHQLKDLELALQIARKISALPASINMPYWARDMELVLLDELNQHESAQLLISSMLQSGEITDPDEIRFLEFRLLKVQQALLNNEQ